MHTRITAADSSVKSLHKVLMAHVKLDRSTAARRERFAQHLRSAAAGEGYGPLQVVVNAIANCLENQESVRREILCQRFEETLLSPLSSYHNACFHPAEEMVKDRDRTLDAYQQAYTAVQALTAKNAIHGKKYRKALETLQANEQRKQNVDSLVRYHVELCVPCLVASVVCLSVSNVSFLLSSCWRNYVALLRGIRFMFETYVEHPSVALPVSHQRGSIQTVLDSVGDNGT